MKKKTLLVLLILVLSFSTVFASSANELYQEFSTKIESSDLRGAIDTYSSLKDRSQSEMQSASKSMDKAWKKGNMELFLEARDEMNNLYSYDITKEQSDALLALIVEEDEEQALSDAKWLYENSSYYSPTLSLDYSVNGDGYSYSYTSSVCIEPGSDVMLPDQESIGANANKLGYLAGWGVTENEVIYAPGETIKMPLTDQTLYAIWQNSVSFTDSKTNLDQMNENVKEGDEIQIPQLSATEDGSVFIGWYDATTGEFLGPEEEVYKVRGNGAKFSAIYADLAIGNVKTSPYSTLPRNTQVTLSFTVENTGDEDMDNLTVKIESSDASLSVLTDELYFRRLPAGCTGSVSTKVVYTGSESSRSIPLTITVTDENNNSWSESFSLTSK